MSTKKEYPLDARREAIVLQCLFASVATTYPTVGEVVKFANDHAGFSSSLFQINQVLKSLHKRGFVVAKAERHGKRVWTRYSINPSGALHLIAMTKFLPKHIRDYMDALNSRIAAGANALIQEYFEQGRM